MSEVKKWTMEIRVNPYIDVAPGMSRVVTYEEVMAVDEVTAIEDAYSKFEEHCLSSSDLIHEMKLRNLSFTDCYVADALMYDVKDVEIYGLKEEIGKLVARNKLLVEKYDELCSCVSYVAEQLNKILDKQGDEYGYS